MKKRLFLLLAAFTVFFALNAHQPVWSKDFDSINISNPTFHDIALVIDCVTVKIDDETEDYGSLPFQVVQPITLVKFADINNVTNADTDGTPAHEFFLEQVAHVTQGGTYPITLKGNTGGPYTNYFAVFIDWNQDGIFDPVTEYIGAGTITNSTGINESITLPIQVPMDALEGDTRLRVKKVYDNDYTLSNALLGGGGGQAEDYTVNVSSASAGTEDINALNGDSFYLYPNPVKDILNIKSEKEISEIKIYSVEGKLVKHSKTLVDTVEVSSLDKGVYLLNITLKNGEKATKKFIKE
ncbi:MAG: T9SS type A sorting domain-containing protein [Flavobacteriaceae bacterium]|nr:T9SS type A sorting domain-containing protein [Flavobacteriaceae bacterium]